MEIKRDIMSTLLKWKQRSERKPLIIQLLPVEVKSGTRLSGKSLGIYISRFDTELALRYSMNNLKRDDVILNIPIFLADWTEKLLELSK